MRKNEFETQASWSDIEHRFFETLNPKPIRLEVLF